jgi:mono/diheme cytochrome c family protein
MKSGREVFATATALIFGAVLVTYLVMVGQDKPVDDPQVAFLPGNPQRGGELFRERGCMDCHGAGLGLVELSSSRDKPTDFHEIAAAMWNHAPMMWEQMGLESSPASNLTVRELVDLLAFLFTAGYLEDKGDAARGEALFAGKGCVECHSTKQSDSPIGDSLVGWSSRATAVLWAQTLWNHAPVMEEMARGEGRAWPNMTEAEAADLLAFLQGADTNGIPPLLGDPWVGRYLFRQYCRSCHRAEGGGGEVGPDLGASAGPRTVSGFAASFWNHGATMSEGMKSLGVKRPSLSEEEMADLTTYLFAIRYVEVRGDRRFGYGIYERSCSACHGIVEESEESRTVRFRARWSPARMAAVLWNHGPHMYAETKERGLEWPLLEHQDMRDLIAFLQSSNLTAEHWK